MENNLNSTGRGLPVSDMGLSDGQTASLVGFEDNSLSEILEAVGVEIVDAKKPGRRDHYFVYMDSLESTITFGLLKQRQGKTGAIWAIFKKENKELTRPEILTAAEQKNLTVVFETDYQQEFEMIKFMQEQAG